MLLGSYANLTSTHVTAFVRRIRSAKLINHECLISMVNSERACMQGQMIQLQIVQLAKCDGAA
jgi:hypothetical protein